MLKRWKEYMEELYQVDKKPNKLEVEREEEVKRDNIGMNIMNYYQRLS